MNCCVLLFLNVFLIRESRTQQWDAWPTSVCVNLAVSAEQRERAIHWLKAFGVGAVIAPGPKSSEDIRTFGIEENSR